MVKDINFGSQTPPSDLTNVNGALFFSANDSLASGFELWKSDGTAAGTMMVKDIEPGPTLRPRGLTNVNGTLYFTANDGAHGAELWKSDGTAAGTVMVKDITWPGQLQPLQPDERQRHAVLHGQRRRPWRGIVEVRWDRRRHRAGQGH